jgi:hypothetical protein
VSGDTNLSILDKIRVVLQGRQQGGDQQAATVQDIRLTPDRDVSIWSKTVGHDGTRERIVTLDANGILRLRPYEAQHPIDGVVLTATLATIYTSADAESRVWVEVVNTLNAAATCQVTRHVNAASAGFSLLPSGTPVPQGVGIRIGPFDLLDTGFIRGSSSPGNSCTMHLTIDRYNATGDTP